MLRSSGNVDDREEKLRNRNRIWIEKLFLHCKEMEDTNTPLERATLCLVDRGGIRDSKFASYDEARDEFLALYENCDVEVLPRDKAGSGDYIPPETMDPEKLIRYGKAILKAVEPFNCVSLSAQEEWDAYCELTPQEVTEARRDISQLIFSWERICMTEPLPERLTTRSPKSAPMSPWERVLVERREGSPLMPSPTTLKSTPDIGRKVKVGKIVPDTTAVVEVSGVPAGFISTP